MRAYSELYRKCYNRLLKMHYESNVGHLGGNISCLGIMLYLHHFHMKPDDIFVLSKGHSAGALYVTLWSLGEITDEELSTFDKDGTNLCAHITSKHSVFATGSLGHGLSLAAGYATQKKLSKKLGDVYVLLSDGELQEGSTQEAMNFIEMRKLDNVTMIVDSNGLQGFDRTLINPNKFGFVGIGGDEFKSLQFYLDNRDSFNRKLGFITTKGKGLPFSNELESHYRPITKEEYEAAIY